MTTAEMEIPRQLRRAAEIIDERGHTRYSFGSPDGPVCLASALAEANGTPSKPSETYGYLDQQATEAGGVLLAELELMPATYPEGTYVPVSPICGFNNRSTTEEITTKLRDTADKLEVLPTREVVMR